jgi:hypothetical protein
MRPALKANNLFAICDPMIYKCGIFDVLEPYYAFTTVTGIAIFTDTPRAHHFFPVP